MKIGFIGLGIMGESMCENIVKKHDNDVYVFDTVASKVQLLKESGAFPCANALELARKSDVIITMLPKSEHSKAVYTEILEVLDSTKICIDMSTIDPSVSIDIAHMVKTNGSQFLDAPVVKSKPAAVAGKLGIYVGGDINTFQKITSILFYMGENIKYMGKNGKGIVMKICHNALVAQIQNGVNETLALAEKNGINIKDYTQAISYGGGQNFYLDGKVTYIENEDYTTAFSVENMAKDVDICINLARESDVLMPGGVVSKEVYRKALEKGIGKEDFCATVKIVREQSSQKGK
jgi:3-hydroxyisobutyrate dehydrogenase-like beta-hydroxyacid dehydrogenase